MSALPFRERRIWHDSSLIAANLPLGDTIAALHPSADSSGFALVADPRTTPNAVIIAMMVLRPASERWMPPLDGETLPESIASITEWCYDVARVGGSWPISAGNAFDAYRLALQYGAMDAVMAGSATITREGRDAPGRRAHLWQPYTPLSWPALKPFRDALEPSIMRVRAEWQELGALSARKYPAQIAVTQSGGAGASGDVLDARIFDARHPDGTPVESYLLTSAAGAEALRARARSRQKNVDAQLLVASGDDDAAIDLARVPKLLRDRLDARLVQHDGGATSLMAFADASALSQLNLTLMRSRSVRDVLETSPRLDGAARESLLENWPLAARLFPSGGGRLPWKLAHAVAEEGASAEAVAASFAA